MQTMSLSALRYGGNIRRTFEYDNLSFEAMESKEDLLEHTLEHEKGRSVLLSQLQQQGCSYS